MPVGDIDSVVDDPRVSGEHVRECAGGRDDGDVVLIGAVHDHPASRYRAGVVTGAVDPDVLALELPPLAVPLFEQYAGTDRTPPDVGGEMSTAIHAATTDRVVGVDGPSPGFARKLAGSLIRERPAWPTSVDTVRALLAVTKHSLVCRIAAGVMANSDVDVHVDVLSSDYGTTAEDAPEDQSADERRQVRRARSVMEAFGTSPSTRLRNEVREEYMADRLSKLRQEGTVVAVVGIDHLEPLAVRLDPGRAGCSRPGD